MSTGPDAASAELTAVLVAAQAGEAWALRAVYEDLSPRVAGYLRARGARDVDDLTSEVFLAVFARLKTITGGYAGLRTLVFFIAHARLVDSLRAGARQPDTVPYQPLVDPRVASSAEDDALASLGSSRAAALLAELPASQREVLVLRVLGDLTVEQVAGVLGTSEGAVKQLQRRGLIALRALIAARGVTL